MGACRKLRWIRGENLIDVALQVIGILITMLQVKQNFFSRANPSTSVWHHFPPVFTSHSASNSQVPEVWKIVLTFFMMSETQSTAVEKNLFLSKPSIVIKLRVKHQLNQHFCCTIKIFCHATPKSFRGLYHTWQLYKQMLQYMHLV